MSMDAEATRSGSRIIELLQQAIQQLTESTNAQPSKQIQIESDNQFSPTANTIVHETQILTNLISQLQSLKEDGIIKQSESSTKANEEQACCDVNEKEGVVSSSKSVPAEELAKELRDVKRQNTMTHWLLSGLIVVTMVWQISEGLVIMKVRDGVKHPFRSLWSWFSGRVRPPITNNAQDAAKQPSSIKDTLLESAYLPIRLTKSEISHKDFELPQMQLPTLVSGKKDE